MLKTSASMPKLNMSKTHTDGFKPDSTNNGLSINGFYPLISGALAENRKETETNKQSPFEGMKARRAKLYNSELFNNYSEKLNSIKEKYTTIQKQIHSNSKNLNEKTLRELIKETEDVFAKTYSIKYFGINRDQIGIMSRRVPIRMADRNLHSSSSHTKLQRQDYNVQSQKFGTNQSMVTKSSINFRPSTRGAVNPTNLRESNQRLFTPENFDLAVTQEDQFESAIDIGGAVKTENPGDKAVVFSSPSKSNAEIEQFMIATEAGKQKAQEYFPHPEEHNAFVVNKYFIPKQLQVLKKPKKDSTSADKVSDLIDLQLIPYTEKDPKKPKVPSNYERLTKSVTRVKRAMFRAPKSSLRTGTEPSQAELIEADKYKTHELKQLLAEKDNLSYAKLLNSFGEPEAMSRLQSLNVFEQPRTSTQQKRFRNQSNGESQAYNSMSNLEMEDRTNVRANKGHSLYHNYVKLANRYQYNHHAYQAS